MIYVKIRPGSLVYLSYGFASLLGVWAVVPRHENAVSLGNVDRLD